MFNKNHSWIGSIFCRLLFAFILIIIPLYFGGFSIYSWGINTVKQEILRSMIAQVSNYLNAFESDVQKIKDNQYQVCVSDDDFESLAVTGDALSHIDRTRSINRLRIRMLAIKSSNKYIENVNAYIPTLNRAIYATGSISEIPEHKYEIFSTIHPNTLSQLIYWDKKLYIFAVFPQQYLIDGRKPRMIEIELSINSIKDALEQIDRGSNWRSLFFSLYNDLEISTGFNGNIPVEIKHIIKKKIQIKNHDTFSIKINDNPYLVIYTLSDYLGMVLCRFIPEEQIFGQIKKYKKAFCFFTLIALLIIVLFSLFAIRYIHQPLKKLICSFEKLEEGNLEIQIYHNHKDEFQYIYKRFNAMVKKLNLLVHQVYKQKIFAQEAELKHLQSQINPHFLYNSFFCLNNMIMKGDYETAEQFTNQLGIYFHFITRNASDMVTLDNEVAHARIYAKIQERRFRNRIKVEFQDTPEEVKTLIVPRLIVQPIIENAFVHGLKDVLENGLLRVIFVSETGRLMIQVEDNGKNINEEQVGKLNFLLNSSQNEFESTAIINIHRRIRIKYGNDSGIKFCIGELKGLKVELLIVYEGGKQNENVQAFDS